MSAPIGASSQRLPRTGAAVNTCDPLATCSSSSPCVMTTQTDIAASPSAPVNSRLASSMPCAVAAIDPQPRQRVAALQRFFRAAIVEGGHGAKPLVRVVGDDTYTPLAGAANLILPTDATVLEAALKLVQT